MAKLLKLNGRQSKRLMYAIPLVILLLGFAYYQYGVNAAAEDLGVSFIIHYEDGTSREANAWSYYTTPGSVIDPVTTKVITSVDYVAALLPVINGPEASHSVTGTVTVKVDGITKQTNSISNPATLVNNAQNTLYTGTISGSTLQSYNTALGSHTLLITASVTVSVTFTDGTTDSKTGSNSGSLNYSVVSYGITSISVSVTPTQL
jgi:hypothetical protein